MASVDSLKKVVGVYGTAQPLVRVTRAQLNCPLELRSLSWVPLLHRFRMTTVCDELQSICWRWRSTFQSAEDNCDGRRVNLVCRSRSLLAGSRQSCRSSKRDKAQARRTRKAGLAKKNEWITEGSKVQFRCTGRTMTQIVVNEES